MIYVKIPIYWTFWWNLKYSPGLWIRQNSIDESERWISLSLSLTQQLVESTPLWKCFMPVLRWKERGGLLAVGGCRQCVWFKCFIAEQSRGVFSWEEGRGGAPTAHSNPTWQYSAMHLQCNAIQCWSPFTGGLSWLLYSSALLNCTSRQYSVICWTIYMPRYVYAAWCPISVSSQDHKGNPNHWVEWLSL